jgi:hypothetical protein
MTLIEDAKAVWHKLWSVRLSLLAAAISTAQAAMDAANSGQARPAVIAAAIIAAASAIARLIQQPALTGDKAAGE